MKKLSGIKSLLELHQKRIKEKYNVRQLGIFVSNFTPTLLAAITSVSVT